MGINRLFGINLANEGDFEGAEIALKKAIEEGDILAINDYGVVCEREGKYSMARSCYMLAGVLGHSTAITNLGNMYENGISVRYNPKIALMLYKRSASLGCSRAHFKLGRMYIRGKGVEKDRDLAKDYLEKGYKIEQTLNDEYECAIELGCDYDFGLFGEDNRDKALEYYTFASERGCALGYYNAGFIYLNNNDPEKAVDCWHKAGKLGYGDGYSKLFEIYWLGEGTIKQDKELAKVCLQKGLKLGSWHAQIRLADVCLDGDLGEVDVECAKKAIAHYLAYSGEYKDDYWSFYEDIKNSHRDELDWEAIERDPEKYLEDSSDDEDC